LPYKILNIQSVSDSRIKGFHLDTPTTSYADSSNKILLSGWVVALNEPVSHIEIKVYSGDVSCCIHTCPLMVARPDVAEHLHDHRIDPVCGFSTSLMTLGLPRNSRLSIHGISVSEQEIPLSQIHLQRSSVYSGFNPQLQPIIVTTLGRTGSTWLMQLLAKHPSIIVADQYPYETFALEYWLHLVSQHLLSPQQMLSAVDQKRFSRDFLSTLSRQSWYHERYYPQVLEFCQQAIENYYLSIAESQNMASPHFFAEKIPYFSGDGSTTWRQIGSAVRELYPQAKEIILVRDFRDMVLSALHFGAKQRDLDHIERQKPTAYQNVTKEVTEFSAYYKLHRNNTHLLRYEDLLLNTRATLKALFSELSIPDDDNILATITRNKHQVSKSHQHHITSPSVEKSVQRWKNELTPQLQGKYTDMFRYDLNLFGYDA
jgi:hypothetical protein